MTTLSELVFIDSTGYHYQDYPTFLEWLQNEYRLIYGEDVYLEPDSQDGQWIAIIARALYDSAVLGASVYNSFSPSTAQGVGLSRVVKINGIQRRTPTFSTVDLDIGGTIGTTINNGVAIDTLGQRWALPASVTIPGAGTITVTATAEQVGAISAAPNTITTIYTPTLGWQTVNNVLAATEGVPVESDAELRLRQTQSTALPSLSVFEGTIGAVANVDGVIRLAGYENDTGSTDSNGIPAHSISLVVEGGDAQEIGEAIAVKKTPGTGTFGTTTVTVYDQEGIPNDINFYRPTIVDIEVEVTIEVTDGYTSGYEDLIKQAVADYINSLKIGQDVQYTKLFVPAYLPGTVAGGTFEITSIEISEVGDPVAPANVVIAFNEAAACDVSNITVTVVP